MKSLLNKKPAIIAASILIAAALVLVQPSQMWAQTPATAQGVSTDQVSTTAFPQIGNCKLGQQPLNAIDMNTVSVRNMIKTVHVEKEFFNCLANDQQAIVMVTIYNELFENATSGSLAKMNSVETCAKLMNGTVLGCKMVTPSTVLAKISTCTTQPLAFPVRMNMVTAFGSKANPNVAETVEAEKEVFACNVNPATNSPTTMEDVVIFTKMMESMDTGKTLGTKFVVVTCTKDIATANVACK